MERLVVIGAGAIGAGLGGLLAEAGLPVVFIARGAHGRALRERGLRLRTPGKSRTISVPTHAALPPDLLRPGDVVVVSVMGHHTAASLAGLPAGWSVVSWQNGVAAREQICAAGHPCTAAVVYVPAERRAPGEVLLAGAPTPGTVWLGGWPEGPTPEAGALAEALAGVGLRTRVHEDLGPWVRAKLLADLGGILVALCDDLPLDVLEAVRAEARRVFAAAGLPVAPLTALVAEMGELRVVPIDGHQREGGSTRHALARGDVLETAALHGHIESLGRAHGVPTPLQAGLVALASRAVQQGWSPGGLSAAALRQALGAGLGPRAGR